MAARGAGDLAMEPMASRVVHKHWVITRHCHLAFRVRLRKPRWGESEPMHELLRPAVDELYDTRV
jgi:hypothetical protein